MKKQIVALAVLALLAVPTVVRAESDENVTKKRPDRPAQAEIQEVRQGMREELRGNLIENHVSRLTKRFAAYYTRLNNIVTRFDARIAILETDKKDTTDVKAKLALVKTKLAEAKTAGDLAIASFSKLDASKLSELKVERLASKELVDKAIRLYKEVHTLLKDALKSLKLISKPALPAASAAVEKAL